ncbi:baseplate J/gp47 family protein [Sphingomonas sp. R647]|uniref:baseplate assembly protein n=1 Tax=Sphingomonas sp. R647 TaxID=2875233 RepID=UPI001CD3C47F|nr:baseplate J/gp47 family protein [Sphingomonas sp. R647]MCA1199136.1 baseplate J/gp47 family protein [Sphingomonas sp. R647]
MSDPANSSTAIDLSRLPPPSFVAVPSFESIRAELIEYVTRPENLPEFDATVEADPAVMLLETIAWRELVIRQAFNERALQTMLAYATGADLEQLGALVNVPRLILQEADGPTPAIYESDADLRRRIQLAPESFSVAGPATAYRFHALSADATIADALATSPTPDDILSIVLSVLAAHDAAPELVTAMTTTLGAADWPGDVLVSILSRLGDGTASADQIEAVEAIVNDREVRPLTDNVRVASVTLLTFNVLAVLTLFHGPDAVVVLAAAEARLAAYLADARKIGRPVTRSGIIAALHVEGVLNVALVEPATDILPDGTQIAHCTGTDVTLADD